MNNNNRAAVFKNQPRVLFVMRKYGYKVNKLAVVTKCL